jgi:cell division protein FtsQ
MPEAKKIWKKVLVATIWMLVAAGTIVLLIAATRQQSAQVCSSVEVTITGVNGVNYISENEVLNTIAGGRPDLLKGARIKTFDLQQLEELLEQNLWIRNAELFFDNQEVLHVDVQERIPVARVFTLSGTTFYVDEEGKQLPATNNQVARVPVFTSFPELTKPLMGKDSVLLLQVRDMGNYLLHHAFWMAQVEQVQINNYEMELVPKLGRHDILFGAGTQIEQKFKRLELFYQQIMKKTGWNYYSKLDVRYNKQLVAVRRDSASLFASFVIPKDQLQISTTIDSARLEKDTSLIVVPPSATASPVKKDTVQKKATVVPPVQKASVGSTATKKSVEQPKKSEEDQILNEVKSQPVKKQESKQKTTPKAVMPPKEN